MPIAPSVTFVFTPAVQKMRELTLSGELGDIQYYGFGSHQPGTASARRDADLDALYERPGARR